MRLSRAAVTAAGAAAAVAAYRRRRPDDDLAGEVALVTGASRGLGLLIATELAGRLPSGVVRARRCRTGARRRPAALYRRRGRRGCLRRHPRGKRRATG
jgi:hypothetical protein